MTAGKSTGLGLIGCGAFGKFCLQAYSTLPDVRIAAVCDVRRDAADSLAAVFNVPAVYKPAELFARKDVDLVHLATPPSSHHELVLAAVAAGKHCLCEKPLAMNIAQADAMLAAATPAGRIVPVNFVLRYNAVTDAVKAIIDGGVLGKVLSARLTNCASDSQLGANHWFWDRSVSGGIFIEHGVHFFDLYRHWLGAGRVISAHTEFREGTDQQDRVTCEIRHANGAIASHYHGFDQVGPLDRTDHRLVCELGDIRVGGWIPLTLTVDALVDDGGADALAACAPGCSTDVVEHFSGEYTETRGRGRTRRVTQRVRLGYTPNPDKPAAYANSVRDLLADQLAYLRAAEHPRRVSEDNGRAAVALAEAAARLAAGTTDTSGA